MTDIAICGCGAVGSQLALFLARQDIRFTLIDDDRIEENNILTTAFSRQHIGAYKATVLGELVYRKAQSTSSVSLETLTVSNMERLLANNDIILDCFDNMDARRLTTKYPNTLHIGVSMERTGAITWNENYTVYPGLPRGEEQFCTHQAGRAILRLTASLAAYVVDQYISNNQRMNMLVTETQIIRQL